MVFFNVSPGQLVALPDPALAARSRLIGMTGFPVPQSIITRLTISTEGNYQCLHSLGGQIFIYVFGDRVGSINMSGLSFQGSCGRLGNSQHGVESILTWYNQYRLAANQFEMEIMVGTTSLRGFLAALHADLVNTENRVFSYNATILLPPIN